MSLRVDYLCRGMGWAHAARTAAVASGLRRRPEIDTVSVAAAGSAVEYFGLVGAPCHDLRVPDDADHSGYAAYRLRRHLASVSPQRTDRVVVSDELCLAPMLCNADRLPCVLMICSFRHLTSRGGARAFDAAPRILLASWPEVDAIPLALRHKVTAIGPIVQATTVDRVEAREQLGLPAAGLVVTVSLGSYHPSKVDYFRTVLRSATDAWRHAPTDATLVVPLPAATVGELLDGVALPVGVQCIGATRHLDTYHLASDVILSMGGSTTSHAVRNGVPTVVISPSPTTREHRVGKYLASRCDSVILTVAGEGDLWPLIDALRGDRRVAPPDLTWGGTQDVLDAVLAS